MATPVSGAVSWNTPVTINSGDVVTATDLNNLNKDVAFQRARPYAIAVQSTAPTTATLPNSTILDGSAGTFRNFFATNNGGAIQTMISTSAVGTITISGDGNFVTPTAITGLYRCSAQVMMSTTASSFGRVSAFLYDSAGTLIGAIPGTWATGSASYNAVSRVEFIIPFNVSSLYGTVNQVRFIGQSATSTLISIVTNDSNSKGPGSTPKQGNTFASVEYLGTSTGAY